MNINQAYIAAKAQLHEIAGEEAPRQARFLVAYAAGVTYSSVFPENKTELTQAQIDTLTTLITRRKSGEPLQYILGTWSFMGLDFYVRPGALIPRQDTETVVEAAMALFNEHGYHSVLDMCCGSGCIGLSMAKLCGADVTLCDISKACIELSRENAQLNGVSVNILQSDMFQMVTGKQFDLIICNPPYIRVDALAGLARELAFEPRMALDGGTDGLDFYRRIAEEYKNHLTLGGTLVLEIGYDQAADVTALLGGGDVIKDVAGNDRCVVRLG